LEKAEKEKVVAELTERLRATETLIVADYRGLTNKQLEALRGRLVEHGARFAIVKNTLTRRAAEAAGAEALLALLEGPTAIAFIESDGDPAAVAKALAETARETRLLALRGGMLQGNAMSGTQVDELAKLPPLDVLKGQVVGAIVAPLNQLVGLLHAPLQNLVGLIDARIEQLGGAATGEGASADAGTSASAEVPGQDTGQAASEPDATTDAESGADDTTEEPSPGASASAEAPQAESDQTADELDPGASAPAEAPNEEE
jgi:large subunit ribosomal protein L10